MKHWTEMFNTASFILSWSAFYEQFLSNMLFPAWFCQYRRKELTLIHVLVSWAHILVKSPSNSIRRVWVTPFHRWKPVKRPEIHVINKDRYVLSNSEATPPPSPEAPTFPWSFFLAKPTIQTRHPDLAHGSEGTAHSSPTLQWCWNPPSMPSFNIVFIVFSDYRSALCSL